MRPMPNQIRRWLMQPNLRRFVGFASTGVGLLCYALSSSFNYLFGRWNLLKIFLYSVFSFIICLAIFFAEAWQHSTSLRLKTHLAFLVLAITSVYSFFFDKGVNGKSDIYNLISCAAFAIMSLSLSRRTNCGFEVDLLYFFLGFLIVQLMKIKLLLGIVGAGFILRSSLDAPQESGYVELQDLVVIRVDSHEANTGRALFMPEAQQSNTGGALIMPPAQQSSASSALIMPQTKQSKTSSAVIMPQSQRSNTDSALIMPQAKLVTCIEALQQNNSNLVDMLLEHVNEYLEAIDEAELVTDHNFLIDALPSGIINDLHETAKLMVAGGLEKECSDVYSSCRRKCLEECLSKLLGVRVNSVRIGKRTKLEGYIRRWTKVSNVTLKILFPSERQLCDRIFGFSSASDFCFAEVCQIGMFQLLKFADVIASGSPSAWRLFKILDMFETLRGLIPPLESLFSDAYSVTLVNEAITIQNRLGEAISGIFMVLGNLIFCIPEVEEVVSDGGVHPITLSAMSYLRSACQSRQTLEQILQEYPKGLDREEASSSFLVQMVWIMKQLQRILKAESKIYNDPALPYIFMMNNRCYIEQKVKECELGSLLGDDWFRKNSAKVRQNLELYLRSSWNKVLDFLKLDSNEAVALDVTTESMKEKLNLFNLQFEEMCRVHSTRYVIDEQLRKEIRICLGNILLPAYGNFVKRFEDVLGKGANEYVRHGLFDIQARLNNLFRGSSEPKEKARA